MAEKLKSCFCLIKYILLLWLFVFIMLLMKNDTISNAEIASVGNAVTKAIDMEGLSMADNRMLKRFYGLNGNDYEGVQLYVSDSYMEVEEVLIVKLKDLEQSEAVEAAVNARVEHQLDSFEGYGPEQCKLLENHILDIQGNYILFVVHKNTKAADAAFQQSL